MSSRLPDDRPIDEIFKEAGIDTRLYALRAAHPDLAYEIDEIARAIRRARDRLAEREQLTKGLDARLGCEDREQLVDAPAVRALVR